MQFGSETSQEACLPFVVDVHLSVLWFETEGVEHLFNFDLLLAVGDVFAQKQSVLLGQVRP